MGCSCYCGLASRKNRVCWVLSASFALIMVLLLIGSHVEGAKCQRAVQKKLNELQHSQRTNGGAQRDPFDDFSGAQSRFGALTSCYRSSLVSIHNSTVALRARICVWAPLRYTTSRVAADPAAGTRSQSACAAEDEPPVLECTAKNGGGHSDECKELQSCAASGFLTIAAIFFAVACSIPLYVMCCCSHNPRVRAYALAIATCC
jgi:hypothetical protein